MPMGIIFLYVLWAAITVCMIVVATLIFREH
jgi:hypothetical protein